MLGAPSSDPIPSPVGWVLLAHNWQKTPGGWAGVVVDIQGLYILEVVVVLALCGISIWRVIVINDQRVQLFLVDLIDHYF